MVTMPGWVPVLDRKLLRDLWEMKGQAAAIAAVIAAGVAMFVTYLSNFDSLQRTLAQYYARARFADVFASATRVPASIEGRVREIPGAAAVATQVVANVTLDVPGLREPAAARLVSIPERGRPLLNDVYLRRGRWLDPSRPDEVLASEMFCEANGFQPGARVAAIINGRRRTLTIVGVALSPEYVYAIRPGEVFPDKKRFAVLWMNRRALAAAFDMEGGFNDVSVALERGASHADVVARLDRLLEPYGGLGATPRSLQPSAWMLDNELAQLRMFGFITPLIFLSVAAFVLHVALTRALALERPQIAALKALGYSNAALLWHYVKWALVISAIGAVAGVAGGAWLGAGMIGLYNQFFRFPELDYHLSLGVAAIAVGGSLAVAALGAQAAVRRAVRVPAAEAMRPEAPARYRPSVLERARIRLRLTTRMIVRNIERQPIRSLVSVSGIAFAVAVVFVGLSFLDVMERLIDQQFVLGMRQDALVTFVEPRAGRAVHDLAHLPGAIDVEPSRTVAVRLRAGTRTRTVAIKGVATSPRLNRIVDRRGATLTMPRQGLVLSEMLAKVLAVKAGDTLQIEVLEGRRPIWRLPIAALVDDSVGLQAYLHIDALARLLREADAVSAAALTVDAAALDRFYAEVKVMPAIAGVALTATILQNFRETMAETMNLTIFFNVLFAGIIAFGVVYNSARVSLSERARELASLRVLGFTRAEISAVLLGELAMVTLAALPLGAVIGVLLGGLILGGFSNEVYRLSFTVSAATVATSFLTVIGASIVSGFVVRRRLDRLDLVAVLKTRE